MDAVVRSEDRAQADLASPLTATTKSSLPFTESAIRPAAVSFIWWRASSAVGPRGFFHMSAAGEAFVSRLDVIKGSSLERIGFVEVFWVVISRDSVVSMARQPQDFVNMFMLGEADR